VICQRIVRAYTVSGHELVALRGIDFEMQRGEMVAIVGPSGAGKSSLLNLLGGLDRPTAGQLSVNGQNLLAMSPRRLGEYRLREVGFLWQRVSQNLLGRRSAFHNVTLPMQLAGLPMRERGRRAKELLKAVGLAEHQHKSPAQLSGGQQQRVALAVALANQPSLLLADEPTGALDRASAHQAIELLNRLRQEYHLSVLMVTHDLEVAEFADRVLTLRDGRLGQDLSDLQVDPQGKLSLPAPVLDELRAADKIAIERVPEGFLLRGDTFETEAQHQAALAALLPQDAPPSRRTWFKFGRRGA
jgi:ABC-type lipoprotein export system ATPase subunit